jgi:hypothetical protein
MYTNNPYAAVDLYTIAGPINNRVDAGSHAAGFHLFTLYSYRARCEGIWLFLVNVDAAFCPVTTRGAAGVATWEMGSFQSLMPRLNVFILSRII